MTKLQISTKLSISIDYYDVHAIAESIAHGVFEELGLDPEKNEKLYSNFKHNVVEANLLSNIQNAAKQALLAFPTDAEHYKDFFENAN